MAKPKTMVLGLDGATWKLLDPLMDEGVMPTLAALKKGSCYADLQTVVPPMTATAWSSLQTGVGPGKHGIFDWTHPVGHSYVYAPIDSTRIQASTLFDHYGDAALRCIVVNLPMTFPAAPIDGVMVAGMLTPDVNHPGFTYPNQVVTSPYTIDTHLADHEADVKPFLQRLLVMIEQRRNLVLRLMNEESWDLLVTVWVEMDRIQHCLWHVLDRDHPHHDAKLAQKVRPRILEVYRAIDQSIAATLEHAPGANVVFVSDHGFGPCRAKVFLNRWLEQNGFLAFKPPATRLRRVRSGLDRLGINGRHVVAAAGRLGLGSALKKHGGGLSRFAREIDWAHTQAFCHGTNGIRLNIKGREPEGSVPSSERQVVLRRLTEALLEMTDAGGQKLITAVSPREELYDGASSELAPDLLITEHDDSVWFYYTEGHRPELVFEDPGWASGNHDPRGIFMATGPQFTAGRVERVPHITDIFPTLLALQGLRVPQGLDGRVLQEVFAKPIDVLEGPPRPPTSRTGGSADDGKAILRRLKGLGYLS